MKAQPSKHLVLVACSARKGLTRDQYEEGISAWYERVKHDPPGELSEEPPIPTAEKLYSASDLFKKASAWARRFGDSWLILSARHGLMAPSLPTVPYNFSLHDMTKAERRAWGKQVAGEIARLASDGPFEGCGSLAPGARITILAGRLYRDPIEEQLRRAGFAVETPLSGLGIGKQKQWLAAALKGDAPRQLALFTQM